MLVLLATHAAAFVAGASAAPRPTPGPTAGSPLAGDVSRPSPSSPSVQTSIGAPAVASPEPTGPPASPTPRITPPGCGCTPRPERTPRPTVGIGSSLEEGTASYVRDSLGRYYLALPVGPGHRVQICGAGGCVTRTSSDKGPDQRVFPERIADLSRIDFEDVCGLSPARLYGTCPVTVEDPAP